ncbi:hypothetical protein SAMN05660313_00736 [Cellulophaga fucicola]|uniref:Uncharacterized protein n=1 Tax=Cellulophaga fucicola TaxID=76595 RepID=A0A1K1MMX1_9FLAO|nr:hypothetical protein SAMN05660313_00736 [Cellulophaga fucicola]
MSYKNTKLALVWRNKQEQVLKNIVVLYGLSEASETLKLSI